jgi:hypothetical protein
MRPDEIAKEQWLARANAVGSAQARNFWFLLVSALFLFALRSAESDGAGVRVPIIDLLLNRDAVLAVGPLILAVATIAAHGSMAAWGDALRGYFGDDWPDNADRVDLHPTQIDFALYAVRAWPYELGNLIKLVTYPTFLSLVALEAALEWARLVGDSGPGRVLLAVISAPAIVVAALLTLRLWRQRVREYRSHRARAG